MELIGGLDCRFWINLFTSGTSDPAFDVNWVYRESSKILAFSSAANTSPFGPFRGCVVFFCLGGICLL